MTSARVVRYGRPFLASTSTRKGNPDHVVKQDLKELRKARNKQARRGRVLAGVVIVIGIVAAIKALTTVSLSAPVLAVICSLRDAATITAIGVIMLVTVQPKYDRLVALLAAHDAVHTDDGTPTAGKAQFGIAALTSR